MEKYFNPLTKGNYRNIPCPCGSGKKAKVCHGKESYLTEEQVNELKKLIEEKNKNSQGK